jgi:hypothetical protein
MKLLDKIDLHDAVLRSVAVDIPKRTVTLNISAYRSGQSPKREPAEIRFSGVRSIVNTSDFDQLLDNASAGNVNAWYPVTDGTTHIHLIHGLISVDARRVQLKFNK